MKKLITSFFIILLFIFSLNVYALDISKDTLFYVGGGSIGIKLNTNVLVMGMYGIRHNNEVYTPWIDTDIKEGDYIVKYNNKDITSTKGLLNEIKSTNGSKCDITIKRNNKEINTTISPITVDNTYQLGLYIKDYVLGVGTLTYILPEYNLYGALGHQVIDEEYYGGEIYEATVDKIIKPRGNKAGEKKATISSDSIGNISKNTITGIYGTIDNYNFNNLELLNIKTKEEVNKGEAYILTNINDKEVEKYKIEITELKKQNSKDIKGIKFRCIDDDLINKAGGIVQGMSGSPIIQDNKIVGAVTHVMLNNPKEGYGIYIEFMLEDMDIHIVD